jgi:hypothetical protein
MFVRHADFNITALYDYDNIFDLQKDWYNVVKSGHICKDGSCPFVKEANFDYDPEHFLYYRARAITADVPNGNGDMFPYKEVESSYKSFIGRGVYLNHKNDDPELAFGIVLDAVFHGQFKPAYVEILAALDKELTEEKHPGLLRQITSGIMNSTSMSCSAQRAECCICHNVAHNEQELCAHMNPGPKDSPNPLYVKGRRHNGTLAAEINYDIDFIEDSLVSVPADFTARLFEIYASLKSSTTSDQIKFHLNAIQKLLESNVAN